MHYLRGGGSYYTKRLFVVYLKFNLNRASCILSAHPTLRVMSAAKLSSFWFLYTLPTPLE